MAAKPGRYKEIWITQRGGREKRPPLSVRGSFFYISMKTKVKMSMKGGDAVCGGKQTQIFSSEEGDG